MSVHDVIERDEGQTQTGPDRVRKAVIEAAQRLFAERGIHAVSVREIAREVGVSHTLLHLYFGSKDEIVREVLMRRNGVAAENISSAPDAATGIADAFRGVANDREWLRVLAAGLIEGIVPHTMTTNPQAQLAFIERFKGQEQSKDSVDYRVIGAATTAMVIGWAVAHDWVRNGAGYEDMSDEELVDGMANLLQRMVSDYS
ncbi:MAG TPA: helix-turn-helix domain-containing protein [Coriobacteriia bacterium]|nr:helix-turn-helix domain-containing protein [Coriobacteriia bacterium]